MERLFIVGDYGGQERHEVELVGPLLDAVLMSVDDHRMVITKYRPAVFRRRGVDGAVFRHRSVDGEDVIFRLDFRVSADDLLKADSPDLVPHYSEPYSVWRMALEIFAVGPDVWKVHAS